MDVVIIMLYWLVTVLLGILAYLCLFKTRQVQRDDLIHRQPWHDEMLTASPFYALTIRVAGLGFLVGCCVMGYQAFLQVAHLMGR